MSSDYMARTRSLTQVAAFLADLANKYDLAVLVVNQMTTKLEKTGSRIVPALGESWAHATTTRLLLSTTPNSTVRQCTLVKSPHRPPGTAHYSVLECGVRDAVASQNNKENERLEANSQPKRQRQQ